MEQQYRAWWPSAPAEERRQVWAWFLQGVLGRAGVRVVLEDT